jgi:hypothetical protein
MLRFSPYHPKTILQLSNPETALKQTQNKILGNPNFKTTSPKNVSMELKKFCDQFNKIKTRKECLSNLGFIQNSVILYLSLDIITFLAFCVICEASSIKAHVY